MKKLLLIALIALLSGCAVSKMEVVNTERYDKELKEGKITVDEYFFLIEGQKNIIEMRRMARQSHIRGS